MMMSSTFMNKYEISAKENRYRYFNLKANKSISDIEPINRCITICLAKFDLVGQIPKLTGKCQMIGHCHKLTIPVDIKPNIATRSLDS